MNMKDIKTKLKMRSYQKNENAVIGMKLWILIAMMNSKKVENENLQILQIKLQAKYHIQHLSLFQQVYN